jgi:hypothetical protein
VRHDLARLPVFGLLFLLCGEFTPFAVLIFPTIVPYPCRIPAQVEKLQKRAEERRAAAFADLRSIPLADGEGGKRAALEVRHAVRSLGLVGGLWDRAGVMPPLGILHGRVARTLGGLAEDDALLVAAGGEPALEDAEVRLACVERGADVLGKTDKELRTALAAWLRLTGGKDPEDSIARMTRLLMVPSGDWQRKLEMEA